MNTTSGSADITVTGLIPSNEILPSGAAAIGNVITIPGVLPYGTTITAVATNPSGTTTFSLSATANATGNNYQAKVSGAPGSLTYAQCVVNVTSGKFTSDPTNSDPTKLACWGGSYSQWTKIYQVTALTGGVQTLTVQMYQSESSGSAVMQGGPCGLGLNVTANNPASSAPATFTQPVIGATDSTHLVAVSQIASTSSAFLLGNMNFQRIGPGLTSRTSDPIHMNSVVSIYLGALSDYQTFLLNTPQIYISGSGVTGLDGVCANVTQPQVDYISCTQAPGPDIPQQPLNMNAYLTVGDTGYGNTRFELMQMAEVLDVRNLTKPRGCVLDTGMPPDPFGQLPCVTAGAMTQVDGTLTLSDNNMALNMNDVVSEAHHYTMQQRGLLGSIGTASPLAFNSNAGLFALNGQVFGGGDSFQGNSVLTLGNNGSPTQYSSHGGYGSSPNVLIMAGVYRDFINSQYSPDDGGSLIYVGCPYEGCSANQFYHYNIFSGGSAGTRGTLTYYPYTNTMSTNGLFTANVLATSYEGKVGAGTASPRGTLEVADLNPEILLTNPRRERHPTPAASVKDPTRFSSAGTTWIQTRTVLSQRAPRPATSVMTSLEQFSP